MHIFTYVKKWGYSRQFANMLRYKPIVALKYPNVCKLDARLCKLA